MVKKVKNLVKNAVLIRVYNKTKKTFFCDCDRLARLMLISAFLQGRFGNNMFIYIATKIIQKLIENHHNIRVTYVFNQTIANALLIGDDNYISMYEKIKQNEIDLTLYSGVRLEGYFQNEKPILENIDYVRSLFREDNEDRVCVHPQALKAKDIHNLLQKYESYKEFDDDDLIVHLRLDDFGHSGWNSQVIHYECYVDVINSIQQKHAFKNVYIIVDKIRRKYEINYMHQLKTKLPFIKVLTHADVETDVARMFHAKNLLLSNSSLVWIFAILGQPKHSWCCTPTTNIVQVLYKINDATELYECNYLKINDDELY